MSWAEEEAAGDLRPAVDSTGVTGILRRTPPADSKVKLREWICGSSAVETGASDVIGLFVNGLLLLFIFILLLE